MPGLWSSGSNRHVEALKAHPWAAIPRLLGKGADAILSDLLLRCGVFESVSQSNNLSQMSGPPLCDLKPFPRLAKVHDTTPEPERTSKRASAAVGIAQRGLSDIRFIRHRMLYAKPGLNERAQPVGLGRAHVLSRYLDVDDEQQTVHVLKYIFPRQFGLHNVFTSQTDFRDTALGFKDYTIREQEIHRSECRWKQRKEILLGPPRAYQRPLPKRLRKQVVPLVRQLRKRHVKCSYASLLNHYCPTPSGEAAERSIKAASSLAQVSAFCRAIVLKVFPGGFWGSCDVRVHNQQVICRNIDRFVRLRRYECLSLHDVLADIKVHGVEWPACDQVDQASQMSQTDFMKRRELMAELMYYLFDSFLIPLIRGHFHVTESSAHRNQLFYFRQDVWKAISEPTLASLKTSMLEPCNASQVKRALAKRELGISQVRLLPKEAGMRPVINLRRRVQRVQHGRMVLGKSINSILTPAFSILNCEKAMDPGALASALFSVGDIYPRLQAFRSLLSQAGYLGQPLYFAKVDVKACFDTIPQKRLMQLAGSILKADAYNITKFARAKLVGGNSNEKTGPDAVPSWRFLTKATAADGTFDFVNVIESDTMEGRTRTVYVDGVVQKPELRKAVLNLLEEHIESNLITVEGRLYRQKRGIPQGSIISSLLCSYFYADLERGVLDFVNDGKSILLRLIDDFLVISVDQQVAERFMRVMHAGVAEYGVEVKAEKSRANFAVVIDGKQIATLPEQTDFQYCGVAINTVTLDLSKDRERRRKSSRSSMRSDKGIYAELTCRSRGLVHGRALKAARPCVLPEDVKVSNGRSDVMIHADQCDSALKQQMQGMLLSTRYNSLRTVLANLEHGFTEIAQKTYHYIRSLPPTKQPGGRLVVRKLSHSIGFGRMK